MMRVLASGSSGRAAISPTTVGPRTVPVGASASRQVVAAQQAGTAIGTVPAQSRAIQDILNTALVAECLATTFYFTGLTAPGVMRTRGLGGGSSDPNNPGLPPNGNPHQVRFLQAALDAEAKHAATLLRAGATLRVRRFYFPPSTFRRLGSSTQGDSFLGVLDTLETAMVGLYLAVVNELIGHGHHDLAVLAAEIAGIESEHRLLGRVIAGIRPANNLTLEREPFANVAEAGAALAPFLTGRGFAGGATRAHALPSAAHVARLVGKYSTRRVLTFT